MSSSAYTLVLATISRLEYERPDTSHYNKAHPEEEVDDNDNNKVNSQYISSLCCAQSLP